MEDRLAELEKKVAELEKKTQPVNIAFSITNNSDFADYISKCILQYQKYMQESNHLSRRKREY